MKKKAKDSEHTDAPAQEFSLISNDTLLALYRNLLQCRLNSAKGKRRPAPQSWPFDAAAVAVAKDMVAEDTLVAHIDNPAAELVRGKAQQRLAGRARTHRSYQPAFAAQLQSALGAALAHKTKKTGRIAVVFRREESRGAWPREAWTDTLEIARAHKLPMVFISPADTDEAGAASSARSRSELEPGTELPHIVADGHDVVAMYRVAHEAVDRARRDRGPTLIECVPFRLRGRRHQDAIAGMETYLRSKGLLHRGLKQGILQEIAGNSKPARKSIRTKN